MLITTTCTKNCQLFCVLVNFFTGHYGGEYSGDCDINSLRIVASQTCRLHQLILMRGAHVCSTANSLQQREHLQLHLQHLELKFEGIYVTIRIFCFILKLKPPWYKSPRQGCHKNLENCFLYQKEQLKPGKSVASTFKFNNEAITAHHNPVTIALHQSLNCHKLVVTWRYYF